MPGIFSSSALSFEKFEIRFRRGNEGRHHISRIHPVTGPHGSIYASCSHFQIPISASGQITAPTFSLHKFLRRDNLLHSHVDLPLIRSIPRISGNGHVNKKELPVGLGFGQNDQLIIVEFPVAKSMIW